MVERRVLARVRIIGEHRVFCTLTAVLISLICVASIATYTHHICIVKPVGIAERTVNALP